MQQAIELAKQGVFTTAENPNVGCVLVNNGNIIGKGWHQKPGQGHAEVNALANCRNKELIAGCTAYVTLEPCSHFGKTPPCAQALIDAKVARVVIGMQDPNPLVSGRGIKLLNEAGIKTSVGVLQSDAQALNPGFIKRMVSKKPLVRLKMASSIDGKTAMASGESKWITGPQARSDVQVYRAKSCAILTGADTVIQDDARLNVRFQELSLRQPTLAESELRQPKRVIVDTRKRLTSDLALFNIPSDIILVRIDQNESQNWPNHVTLLTVKERAGKADLNDLLLKLAELGVNDLWVETGAQLAGALLEQQLVDELILYQAPKIMANDARGLFDIPQLTTLKDAIPLTIKDVRRVGDDIKLIASINNNQTS
ncbi:bifunctional diaminohydroxyphosphoribosylaminopyrimidine deaminase/5-amino-6-(5-phosphoribosylamino)uracil reductase RibD [Thalassotalea aquiviva]|uniref:bifunctional diaminohydroxyphosphoribosylaminopyrimidine deaminase/5-amino-6-(5-phosphoribosylamino)uracil reductase RibD n=1 Tax=Thalassotalea aquiviva TaxID=3242415 RepID=UPI003529FC33